MAVERVAVGALLAGKYEVLHPVGEGAMGSVWAVRNRLNDRECALKFVRPSEVHGQEHRERLLREARASGRVAHRNVVAVYDVGELEDGSPFLVMELLRGEALDVASRRRRLPVSEALSLMADATRGVAAAHAVGVVHRDLKPGNIFLHRDSDGSTVVKVIDFGVSKVLSAERATSSMTGLSIGSPAYMSPEQARGARTIDARADLWAIGVVLFELASGRLPFEGETPYDTVAQILLGQIPRLRERCPQLDPGLDELVARCLQRDPGLRPQSAEELVAALDALALRLARPAAPEAPPVAPSLAQAAIAATEPVAKSEPLLAVDQVEAFPREERTEPANGTRPLPVPRLLEGFGREARPDPAGNTEALSSLEPAGPARTEPARVASEDAIRRTTSPATLAARRLTPLRLAPQRATRRRLWTVLGALGGAAALGLAWLGLAPAEAPAPAEESASAPALVPPTPAPRAESALQFFTHPAPHGACGVEERTATPPPLLFPFPSPRWDAGPPAAPDSELMPPRVAPRPLGPSEPPVAQSPPAKPVQVPVAATPRWKAPAPGASARVTRPTRGAGPAAPPAKAHGKARSSPSATDELELGRRR